MPSALFKYENLYNGGFSGAINRLYYIHPPLFTACRTLRCKIFPVKLSAALATRLPLTVWRHEAGVSAPASPARCRPNNCPAPEQRQYPANFRAWLRTSVRHFYSPSQTTLANVSEWRVGTTSKAAFGTLPAFQRSCARRRGCASVRLALTHHYSAEYEAPPFSRTSRAWRRRHQSDPFRN